MNGLRKHKKRRIPKLSVKPEPDTMRYYASYRSANGKSKKKRYTRHRKESEIAHHRWIVENYDQSVRILASDRDARKANFDQSLPVIARVLESFLLWFMPS